MNHKLLIIAALFLLSCSKSAEEKPTPAQDPITPAKYQKILGAGLDVDWSKTGNGASSYSEQAVADLKTRGFSHARIRVKDDITSDLLDQLEMQVGHCIKHGVIPIIAYQANDFKVTPTDENLAKVVAWWSSVAERFKGYSDSLSFDILIECTDALNRNYTMINKLFEQTVTAIRTSNPTRIIFISPSTRSDPNELVNLAIPSKANGYLMAEWHFYAAGPSKTIGDPKQWTTGTDAEKKLITDKLQAALDWQKSTGIFTWVGAWMPGNYNSGNDYSVDEQVVFSRFMVSTLKGAGIPFAVNQGNVFYDYTAKQWISAMAPVADELVR